MTHEDETTPQAHPQTQSHTERQLDQLAITVYIITAHQMLQAPGTAPHASDAENKAT